MLLHDIWSISQIDLDHLSSIVFESTHRMLNAFDLFYCRLLCAISYEILHTDISGSRCSSSLENIRNASTSATQNLKEKENDQL